jgi:radical SAM superfamily enzyme YgiQ (UPF0313 family)
MAKAMFITKGGEYYPPMGIMQISAVARQSGHEMGLGILSKGEEGVWEKIEQENPDVVAYSGSTGEHKLYFKFNHKLKERIKQGRLPRIYTIMGGPHATFFPQRTLIDARLDAVCMGEGDYAFRDFLNRVDEGGDFKDLENITTEENKIPKLRPLIQDLDSLPFPYRELFYNNKESEDNEAKHFFIGRGCPYNCSYCFNEAFRGMYKGQKYVRRRSVDNILEEIKDVREKSSLKFIKFYDDVFTLKVDDWLEEFTERYSKEVGLPFFCLTRPELITERMGELLRKAGCKAMSTSIETADDRLRKEILKRKMSKQEIKRGYKILGENGITIQSNNIFGLPTSTLENDIETLDFNIECGPKQGTIVIMEAGTAHPYPGTDLGRFCKEKGFYDPEAEGFYDMHMSYNDESPLNCFNKKEKKLQRNLTMLGPIAVRFPILRGLIVNYLIKLPPNPVFLTLYDINKQTAYLKNVYNYKHSPINLVKTILQTFKLDWFKRMGGERWRKTP